MDGRIHHGLAATEHECFAHTFNNVMACDEFVRASDAFTNLRDLRSGDTNAVFEQLEGELDIGAVSLRAIIDENSQIEHAKNYHNFLLRIADYRAKYPYHSDITNMDSMVAAALAKTTNETGH